MLHPRTERVALDPQDLLLIPLGLAVGAFGTLVGAGGGFILVPILLFLYPDREPHTIASMSLFVVMLNAASGSTAYWRQKRIDISSGLWFAVGTFPGAIAGAVAVTFFPRRTFDGVFAAMLVALALFLLFRAAPSAIQPPVTGRGVVRREVRDRYGNVFVYSFQLWKGVLISTVVGFVSSLFGIGGGVMHVPIMATVLHFPIHTAVATSQFVLALMSAEGSAVHIITGSLGWNSALGQAGLLAAGAIPGAQLGAQLGRRLKGRAIARALAASLLLVGMRLGIKAITG